MKREVAWEKKTATVTTVAFKRIKDAVLHLRETPTRHDPLVRLGDLRTRLREIDADANFDDSELTTAVGHLANLGYLRRLHTATGHEVVLLATELLNNLAASYILEARRNPRGLGALNEERAPERRLRFF